MIGKARILLAALALALIPVGIAAQETGTVTGRVVDQATQQPLSSVQIFIAGSSRGTLTDQQGRFLIPNVAAGSQTVRASLIGYAQGEQVVTVPAGGSATAEFSLRPSAISLDALVVTATGEQRQREVASAVSQVNAEEAVQQTPINNVSQLLTGRAAGVNILQSSGAAGSNARIRIRGSSSISLSNEPIILVDGVRLSTGGNSFTVGVGGQETSELNNINPEDIESIEVIKGPSAATLYGTDAANGVVVITTKKGSASGAPRWSVYVEQGVVDDRNEYPLNFRGRGTPTAAGNPTNCFAFQTVRATNPCTQSALLSFQPLNDPETSPIGTGSRSQYGVSVAGGSEGINYFVSGEFEDEIGVFELPDSARQALTSAGTEIPASRERPNAFERISLRANLGAQIAQGLRLSINTGYALTDTRLPQNDNNAFGVLPSGLLGGFERNAREGFGFLLPSEVFAIEAIQESNRFTGSANLQWEPERFSWLTGRATVGIDNNSRHDEGFTPVGEVPLSANSLLGERISNRVNTRGITGDVGASATFELTPDFGSRTSVGVQYYRDLFESTTTSGEQLGPGTRTVSSAAQKFADEATTESITLGTFVEQQVSWQDRLFVTGGIRADDNSAFGQEFDLIIYPKVGVSFVAVENEGEPLFNALNSLKLRAAYGAAGRAPNATDAVRFLEPATATIGGADVPAVVFDNDEGLGNPDLKPERSTELELGFDAGFLDGRLGLEATYYNKNTTDALIERRLPLSLGVPVERFENIGKVRNRGYEVALHAEPLRQRNVQWDIDVTGSRNDNELVELGEGIEPILLGKQRFVEGRPLGSFFENKVTFNDANGDGIIAQDEVTVADSATFIGSAQPTRELSIRSGLTLFNTVRVAGLLDYRGGYYQYNLTEEFRCRFAICRGLNDPSAPLFEQARAVQTVTRGGSRSADPYIEDASFWKLREVSLSFTLPGRWVNRFGTDQATLIFSGRNLATWSDYTGLDPEVLGDADQNFFQQDFLTQPPVRTITARLNLTF